MTQDPQTLSGRQAQRSHRSGEALLDAAVDLVAQGGLGALTFTSIAKQSGLSRGMVTARFGSKQGLVDALVRRVWGQLREHHVVPLDDKETGLEALVELLVGLQRQADHRPKDMRALFACMFEAIGEDLELRERMVEFQQAMRTDILNSVARGKIDGSISEQVDGDDTAMLLVAALSGISYQWLLEPKTFDLSGAYSSLAGSLRRSLAISK